jgi:hypothetical protein
MMPECDLDDNDPLSIYLKKILMVEPGKASTSSTSSEVRKKANNNKSDSISDIVRQRSENINHGEIDTENDKAGETEVSKQMD